MAKEEPIVVDAIVTEAASRESWIIDGNYTRTMGPRLERADTVLFLDFPRVVCLWRVFKRWLRYRGASRPDLAPGRPEYLSWKFVLWIWNFLKRSRPRVVQSIEDHSADTEVTVLRSQKGIDRFLAQVAAQDDGSTGSP